MIHGALHHYITLSGMKSFTIMATEILIGQHGVWIL